jgi:hypothetical protein
MRTLIICELLDYTINELLGDDTVSANILFIIILAYAVLLQDTMFFIEVTIASFKYNFLK